MSQPAAETTMTGTVVSSTRNSLIVRTNDRVYQVFVFDRDTIKPVSIPVSSVVTVISNPSSEPGVRVASSVVITGPSVPPAPGAPQSTATDDVIPLSVRRTENAIERQAKRFRAGVRAGVGLDPEVLLVGVHANLGTFFHRDFSFRPNVEFGFGEVTKLFAVNLEGIYRLPISQREGRWNAYVGGGPSLVFSHENFERATGVDEDIDFGDFEFDGGLNILTGIQYRSGLFFEVKTTVWASPHLRLIVGYTF